MLSHLEKPQLVGYCSNLNQTSWLVATLEEKQERTSHIRQLRLSSCVLKLGAEGRERRGEEYPPSPCLEERVKKYGGIRLWRVFE